MTPIQKANFTSEYQSIAGNAGGSDRARAEFFHRLKKVLPDRSEFMLFCTGALEQGGAQAAKHWAMAKAFDRVSNIGTWRAIGWAGVRMLDMVKQDDNFKKVEERVLETYTEAKATPRSKWFPIFQKLVPDVVAAVRRTNKPKTKTSDGDAVVERDLLAATVRRLLESAPILRGTLTAKELLICGLAAKATRKTA